MAMGTNRNRPMLSIQELVLRPGARRALHNHTRKPRDLDNDPELRANIRVPKPTH